MTRLALLRGAPQRGGWLAVPVGSGVVQQYEQDRVVVLFEDAGFRTLSLSVVAEEQLLEPA